MRIAELSTRTGVSVATIKYYLREGILPPGELSSPNQASYGQRHVERLRMVRAMVDIARLPIATIRGVLEHLDQPEPNLHNVLGKTLHDTMTTRAEVDRPSRQVIDELIERRDWKVEPDAPAADVAAEVLAALHQLGEGDLINLIDDYAEAIERIAVADLTFVQRRDKPEEIVRGAVIATILGDTLLAALRRLAQESESARRFNTR